MATPAKPNKFDTVNDDPPVIDSESPSFNNNPGAEREELNFDSKRYNEEHKQMVVPTGDWIRDDRWDFDKRKHIVVREDDQAPGDLNPKGRTSFLFAGKPQPRVVAGVSHEPHLFVRISPDNRYKEDEPAKFDLSRRLFDMARETYLHIHGEELTTESQLIYLMTEDTIVLSTFNPPDGDGPMVTRIKPLQERKGKRR